MEAGALQALVDRDAIRELNARWARAFDDGNAEEWAAYFIEDAVFEVAGRLRLEGRTALAEFAASVPYGSVHITTDHVIELDGERARQVCTLVLARRSREGEPATFHGTGRYTDELVRTDAGWRFARRTAQLDG